MTTRPSLRDLTEAFADRHSGLDDVDRDAMLATIGVDSVEDLVRRTVPGSILMSESMVLPTRSARPRSSPSCGRCWSGRIGAAA